MKRIFSSFAFVFSDDDWFNKVLVGGFYLMLSPLAIGFVMLFGFQVELTKRILNKEEGMPMWRNSKIILFNGVKLFAVSSFYVTLIVCVLLILHINLFSVTAAIVLFLSHALLNPLIVRCFSRRNSILESLNPMALNRELENDIAGYLVTLVGTTLLIGLAVMFGWMFIVVGWPLVIFLMMVIQTAAFAVE